MLRDRVNALNSGSILKNGNRPQSGPSLYRKVKDRKAAYDYVMGPTAAKRPTSDNGAKGCKAAHLCVMGPKAAKRPISF